MLCNDEGTINSFFEQKKIQFLRRFNFLFSELSFYEKPQCVTIKYSDHADRPSRSRENSFHSNRQKKKRERNPLSNKSIFGRRKNSPFFYFYERKPPPCHKEMSFNLSSSVMQTFFDRKDFSILFRDVATRRTLQKKLDSNFFVQSYQ